MQPQPIIHRRPIACGRIVEPAVGGRLLCLHAVPRGAELPRPRQQWTATQDRRRATRSQHLPVPDGPASLRAPAPDGRVAPRTRSTLHREQRLPTSPFAADADRRPETRRVHSLPRDAELPRPHYRLRWAALFPHHCSRYLRGRDAYAPVHRLDGRMRSPGRGWRKLPTSGVVRVTTVTATAVITRRDPITGDIGLWVTVLAAVALLAAACGGSNGSGVASGGSSSPSNSAQQSVLTFSRCMRSQGVPNFPDPRRRGSTPQDQRGGPWDQQLPVQCGRERLPAPAPHRRDIGECRRDQRVGRTMHHGRCLFAGRHTLVAGRRAEVRRVHALTRVAGLARPQYRSPGTRLVRCKRVMGCFAARARSPRMHGPDRRANRLTVSP
jgi:hypothetical protein